MALTLTSPALSKILGSIAYPIPWGELSISSSSDLSGKVVYFDYVLAGAPIDVQNYKSNPTVLRYYLTFNTGFTDQAMYMNATGSEHLFDHNKIYLTANSTTTFDLLPVVYGEWDTDGSYSAVSNVNAKRFDYASSRPSATPEDPTPNTFYTKDRQGYIFVAATLADGTLEDFLAIPFDTRFAFYNGVPYDLAPTEVHPLSFGGFEFQYSGYPGSLDAKTYEGKISAVRETDVFFYVDLRGAGTLSTDVTVSSFRLSSTGDSDPTHDNQFYAETNYNIVPSPEVPLAMFGDAETVSDVSQLTQTDPFPSTGGTVPANRWFGTFKVQGQNLIPGASYKFLVHLKYNDGTEYIFPFRSIAVKATLDPVPASGNSYTAIANVSTSDLAYQASCIKGVVPGERFILCAVMDKATYNQAAAVYGYDGGFDDHFQRVLFCLSQRVPLSAEIVLQDCTIFTPTEVEDNATFYRICREFRLPFGTAGQTWYANFVFEFTAPFQGVAITNQIVQSVALQVKPLSTDDNGDGLFLPTGIFDDTGAAISNKFCKEDTTFVDVQFDATFDNLEDYDLFALVGDPDSLIEHDPFDPALLARQVSNMVLAMSVQADEVPVFVRLATSQLPEESCVYLYASRRDKLACSGGGGGTATACPEITVRTRVQFVYKKTSGNLGKNTFDLFRIFEIYIDDPVGIAREDIQIDATYYVKSGFDGDGSDVTDNLTNLTETDFAGSSGNLMFLTSQVYARGRKINERGTLHDENRNFVMDYSLVLTIRFDGAGDCVYIVRDAVESSVNRFLYQESNDPVTNANNRYSVRWANDPGDTTDPDVYDTFILNAV